MKKFILLFLLTLGTLSAKAEIYKTEGSYQRGQDGCNLYHPNLNTNWYNSRAIHDACEKAKDTCYTEHGSNHPTDNFTCRIVDSGLAVAGFYGHVVYGDGTETTCGLDADIYVAKGRCIVEAVKE